MSEAPPPADANPLFEAFLRGAPGRVIHKWRHYFDVYHRHMAPFRGRAPTVLEIGVQNGGSLALWQEYFGPGARIFGMDIDPRCLAKAPPGTRVFIGDQADPEFLKTVLAEIGPPDIVIDDGGHTARQMTNSFAVLYPALNAPGVYLVEDTHTQFWGGQYLDTGEKGGFYQRAFQAVYAMHDWTGNKANFAALQKPPEERAAPIPASDMCRRTGSIAFYDSMIVFTREDRPEPWAEFRKT